MLIGVPQETFASERRVALVPITVTQLKKATIEVVVQSGAGLAAGYPDASYADAGATIQVARAQVFALADVILMVRARGESNRLAC